MSDNTTNDEDEIMAIFSLKNKKKKDKKNKKDKKDTTDKVIVFGIDHKSEQGYTYEYLLQRVMKKIYENNPELTDKKRYIMEPPKLVRIGSKKTQWTNFLKICSIIHRDKDHVFRFFMSELGTEGSFDCNQSLIIRGKYIPKYIESLLRKYISEYVTCRMCRSPNTVLTRDSVSRLYFVNCNDCSSSRSVTQIHTGFHAQTREDRRALRK
jgi:translation initiation factor 2 subunit 2